MNNLVVKSTIGEVWKSEERECVGLALELGVSFEEDVRFLRDDAFPQLFVGVTSLGEAFIEGWEQGQALVRIEKMRARRFAPELPTPAIIGSHAPPTGRQFNQRLLKKKHR